MASQHTVVTKSIKSRPSGKSCQAIAWMTSFFDRIGDKHPDKDGIYLPTCLTEKAIYDQMIEELCKGDCEKAVCFSQFNKLFRTKFPNVTIPEVSILHAIAIDGYIYMCFVCLLDGTEHIQK